MKNSTLQDWALFAARQLGVSPMIADSSGEMVVLDADNGDVYTPTLVSEDDASLLSNARLAREISEDLNGKFNSWDTPRILGTGISHVLYAALTGNKFFVASADGDGHNFIELLREHEVRGRIWEVIVDLSPPDRKEPVITVAELVWAFMSTSKVYAERIQQLLVSLAAQNARPIDLHQLVGTDVIDDALDDRGVPSSPELVRSIKLLLLAFIRSKML